MPSFTGRIANFLSTRMGGLAKASARQHVARYRKSDGKRFPKFLGKPVFLLDVVGRTSGEPRPVMLMLVRRGDDLLVCGSNGGNPQTPNWYRNLMAAERTQVQVGADRWWVAARELPEGDERDECWSLLTAGYPDFASYQELTDRRLPVAVLERVTEGV
ncbi:MAG: nitroreductase family deazaflavin-dependent oxidoreductase [Ilumatobacter sp.]|uniref:nitroreductase family deazaflavin-dependent oxidoreductase n=1 Tax=Ilumatobacter sp. TaxID=1967498 RepID=UPI00261E85B3|nr:nitroreductase family deazaflavin-dependent oxidoreductase [Ilumatobacter sp.]MDJ0767717.1 nitroreductase family deazaflavin-dependent oxidoreductase [Ilumatobacter sp.]